MQAAPQTSKIRFVLKDATLKDHERTEARMGGLGVFENNERYADWLQAMLATHMYLSESLDRVSALLGMAQHQDDLISAILDDLEACSDRTPVISADRYRAGSRDHMIGAAYTIEGSALGARVIEPRLRENGLTATRYVSLMSASSKTRWPHFASAIDDAVSDVAAAITGSKHAFHYLETTLNGDADDKRTA